MAKLEAFVGHSFSKEDEAVVNAFLDFFTGLQDLGIGLAWDHAEPAEPKVLSEKVKAKMVGKNLFIGICTAKEYAVQPGDLSAPLLAKTALQGAREKFQPKTSDWVIQEIGYAIGKEMHVILLLEDGVRRPGGLQGDLEHIPFNRDNPAAAFPKILQMLRALIPKAVAKPTSPAAAPVPAEEDKKEEEGIGQKEPQPDWSQSDFERAALAAVVRRDEDRLDRLRDAFAKSSHGGDEDARDGLEAFVLMMQSVMNKGGNVDRLQELARKHPKDRLFADYVADALEQYELHDKAAAAHITAASLSADDEKRASSLARAAVQKAKANDGEAEVWLREQFKSLNVSLQTQRSYLWALKELAELRKAPGIWSAYQEAMLDDQPDDHSSRFSLAHKYSDQGNNRMALYHYLKIPVDKRNAGTWNNIGVAARNLGLKAVGVTAYQRSKAHGGTLATSNLAYILLEAGFVSDAETMCKEALALPDCDNRVAAALGSIDEYKTKDEDSQRTILVEADRERAFAVDLGRALASPPVSINATTWQSPECVLTVTVDGGRMRAEGKYTVPDGGLMAVLRQSTGMLSDTKTMVVEYEGEISGRGCVGTRRLRVDGETPTLLGTAGENVSLIIEADGQSIREMRNPENQTSTFPRWSRKSK